MFGIRGIKQPRGLDAEGELGHTDGDTMINMIRDSSICHCLVPARLLKSGHGRLNKPRTDMRRA